MAAQIQVQKRGAEMWDVTRVEKLWDNTWSYETVARVVRDGAFYYVEFVEWKEETHVWVRQPRGYLIPTPALKVAARGPRKTEVM